jgi:pantothenate synthetase
LDASQRKQALILYHSLLRARDLFAAGERDSVKLIAAATHEFASEPDVRLDYLEIVDPGTLEPVSEIADRVLVTVAAFVGSTRLIDNILLEP